jgi:hypothetical protein
VPLPEAGTAPQTILVFVEVRVRWNLFSGPEPEVPVMLYDGWSFQPVVKIAEKSGAELPPAPQGAKPINTAHERRPPSGAFGKESGHRLFSWPVDLHPR